MTNCTPVAPDVNSDSLALTPETHARIEAACLKLLRARYPGKRITPNGDRAQLERRGYRVDGDGIMRHGATVISTGGWPF
jgi:hypothetical protein